MDTPIKSNKVTSETIVREVMKTIPKLEAIVESSPDCIKFFDMEKNLVFINNGGRKEHNLTNETDVKNFKAVDSVLAEDRPKFIKAFDEALNGISSEVEIRHTKNGSNRDVCLETITPIRDSMQNIIGILGVSRDLTDRKKAEELIWKTKIFELQRTKNEFVSIAAHQLLNPITSIVGFASIFEKQVKEGGFTEEEKDSVKIILNSANNMKELINFLLKITRVESGNLKLEPVPINLIEIVKSTIEILSSGLDQKNQTVEISQNPDPLPFIFLDKEIIKQVILNLLSNANRYSFDNSVIKVSMTLIDSFVQCSIKNNGIGIPKSFNDKIFEKFFRADNAKAKVQEGTGLGLSLVKSFVEAWGGRIWFESDENKETTFYFTIPIVGKTEAVKEIIL